ncbi:MAG: NADH-quinone oxidoreductase subunit NuoE [Gammaproteobacteria bacterium]|nr:NADH-quinone oxidoreductase subunit NuoE [Gammaproteobacteria bacterium]
MLSEESRAKIDQEIAKYPPEHKQSAVMAALHIAQDEHGWLSVSLMDYVAGLLDMRPIQVYEVASFYTMYDLKPVGRHKISLCTNISCLLRGSDDIASHLKKRLGIGFGETTPDGRFTLKEVECLAACGGAPMFMIDKTYYENLTPGRVDEILDKLE